MSDQSFRYSIRRGQGQRFSSRMKYLSDLVRASGSKRFCQAMAARTNPTGIVSDGTGPKAEWEHFPWLTLVLGSGCLDLPSQPEFKPEPVSAAVRKVIDQTGMAKQWGEVIDLPTVAGRFTLKLATSRLGPARGEADDSSGVNDSDLEIEALAAHLCLVAALSTRFFHTVRAMLPDPMGRWDDDIAIYPNEGDDPDEVDVTGVIIDPLRNATATALRELEPLVSASDGNPVLLAVGQLLDEVDDGLGSAPYELREVQVRLLTEVAWHFLTRGTTVYPGWTDLLLGLLLNEAGSTIRGSRRPRPQFVRLAALPGVVRRILDGPTKASWARLTAVEADGDEPSTRDRLYAGAADVLWAQSEAITGLRLPTMLPPATAFVTSFDLELEMALLLQAAGRPFSVAIPVHLLDSEMASDAEPAWLLGRIDPSQGDATLETLTHGATWEVLSPKTDQRDPLRTGPVVVHLNGCPMFEEPAMTPKIREGLDELRVEVSDKAVLTHAVTVDEYLAMRQSAAELSWNSERTLDNKGRVSRGLHQDLTKDSKSNPRFWMAIGVPIADSAIRHRVVSQITLRWAQDEGPSAVEGAGIAVNRRIDDDEASLLFWLGMDVVEDDCQTFIGDLRHYAKHVRHGDRSKRIPLAEVECEIT